MCGSRLVTVAGVLRALWLREGHSSRSVTSVPEGAMKRPRPSQLRTTLLVIVLTVLVLLAGVIKTRV